MIRQAPALEPISDLLRTTCRELRFSPGERLREKGRHYDDLYLILEGWVDVELGRGLPASAGPYAPIGEIGFLRGCAATATVVARTATVALVIDDELITRLERREPFIAAQLLRGLAAIAEARLSFNVVKTSPSERPSAATVVEVLLCRSPDMLEQAQRLRYQVYCQELGRKSPYADHVRQLIADPLDSAGRIFLAVEAGEPVGTLRANPGTDVALGVFEELYGMKKSPHHPHATAICTKFIVAKAKRSGLASMKLIAAVVRFGLNKAIRECYIDCIPELLPFYQAVGFAVVGGPFLHRENGPSYPMAIDLALCGERLSRWGGEA